MEFTRQNILGTIGKGHYHSCVLTCYSFDFQFFELRVMRALRAAGIKNILVLMDAHYLQHLAKRPSGLEFTLSVGFSIYPIYVPHGVFHPKLALLFGKKEGGLLVGSGNLTSSGLGNNDEAWGSFHLNDADSSNAPLFADAWEYIQGLTHNVKGVAADKLDWIREFSPWLKDLPTSQPGSLYELSQGIDAAFLTNGKQSILRQTLDLIGEDEVNNITSISPYYDQTGLALRQLRTAFPTAKLTCVVEERSGTLPLKLDPALAASIDFYQWRNCGPPIAEKRSHLHAKLLHFSTSSGEYLLMGSANVTSSGMGSAAKKAVNEEASVLLFRPRGNYLKGLGIKLKSADRLTFAEVKELPEPLYAVNEENTIGPGSGFPVIILLAELEATTLTLHLPSTPAGLFDVVLLDENESAIFSVPTLSLQAPTVLSIPEAFTLGSVRMVELRDRKQRIAGRQFVQYPAEQNNFSPDPKLKNLQQAFADIESSGFQYFGELWDLIDLEDYAGPSSGGGKTIAHNKEISKEPYENLPYDEFNKLAQPELERQRGLLNSIPARIEDFLTLVGRQLTSPTTSQANSGENEQDIDAETGLPNVASAVEPAEEEPGNQPELQSREVKSIDRFLQRLLKYQSARLKGYATEELNELALPKLTFKDLSVMNVALYLALHYVGRPYTAFEKGKEKQAYYLYKAGELYDLQSLKAFCNLIIGNFLLMATAGFAEYKEPNAKRRSEASRQSIFERVVFLVNNSAWKDNESDFRDLLLFNAMHFLRPSHWTVNEMPNNLLAGFATIKERAHFTHEKFDLNYQSFLKKYLKRLEAINRTLDLDPLKRTTKKLASINPQDWVYMSKLGITSLQYKEKQDNGILLTLMRPGFQLQVGDERRVFEVVRKTENSMVTV